MLNGINKKIKGKIWNHLKNYFFEDRLIDNGLIQNINLNPNLNQKKALISYMTKSYVRDWEKYNAGKTQPFEILIIAKTITDLGYCLDVAECNELNVLEQIRHKKYDLIFGFGEVFYNISLINPQAESILYMTENHPEFSEKEEKKRIDYFNERHNKKIGFSRSGTYYKIHHLEKTYSELISMGIIEPHFGEYKKPYTIFPTGIFNKNFKNLNKDQLKARKNFIWLGSYGAIHKGLDLLIDVFKKHSDISLFICGLSEDEKNLFNIRNNGNIHNYGFVDIKSNSFLDLVDKCSFVILPSCSEACATSVTTGMLHGLIPVVMKNAGFDRLGENAFYLDDFKIDLLEERIREISQLPDDQLQDLSKKVYNFAHHEFTLNAFEERFKSIMKEIFYND